LITIPIERLLHNTFGDPDNPEGLATLEAMWRLERYKYNLELIQGIGFEHAAGHAKFTAEGELSADDITAIRQAARAIMTAQEGNYMALPNKIQGDIIDAAFAAAESLLTAIRYYGILKLALLGMQWAALGTLSPYGSYSQGKDSSDFYLNIFNSIAEGQVNQADQQIGRRLFENPANAAAFPNMTARPVLSVDRAQKVVGLADLGAFMTAMTAAQMPLGDDDYIAFRQKSDFLPEVLPEIPIAIQEMEPKPEPDAEDVDNPEDASMFAGFRQELVLLQSPDYADGAMVCLYVPADMAARMVLDVPGALPAEELHLTLAYLGSYKDMPADRAVLERCLQDVGANVSPVVGRLSGMGRFVNPDIPDGSHVIYASYDAPNLPGLRQLLIRVLDGNGFRVSRAHGFTPHITLAYVMPKARTPEMAGVYSEELTFDKLGYSWGEDRGEYDLGGLPAMLAQRRVAIPEDELPIQTEDGAFVTEADADRAARAFERWAEENNPELAKILRAKVVEEMPE
jgi:2'-5' RNA ligase